MLDCRDLNNQLEDQIVVLEQLISNSIEVSFKHNESYPSANEVNDLLSLIHKSIPSSENNQILIEIQLILFLTTIQGISLSQAIQLKTSDWNNIEDLYFQDKRLQITAKNNYCTKLILINRKNARNNDDRIFSVLKPENVIECLNLYLVMNGFEYNLTENKLQILFGRFLYLRFSKIRSVREFLKEYFGIDSHIELLVKLNLVGSIHYNTMMRN